MKTFFSIILVSISLFFVSCKQDEPKPEPTTVTDIDGNVYNIITIGNQKWLAENLRVSHYNNGDAIETTSPASQDLTGQSDTKFQWSYNGNTTNLSTYGLLYSWNAITDSRGIAPEGWHVPTESEWNELITFLGGENVAGGKLKATGNAYWISPNNGATNEVNFSAMPNGNRNVNGEFFDQQYHATWWTSTGNGNGSGNYKMIHKDEAKIYSSYYGDAKIAFGVRCIKD